MKEPSRRPRAPRGTLTGPKYQLEQAMVEEQYRALETTPWDCALCGLPAQRFPHGFVYECQLSQAQHEMVGHPDRNGTIVSFAICAGCRARPDIDDVMTRVIEQQLAASAAGRRPEVAFDLGDLPHPVDDVPWEPIAAPGRFWLALLPSQHRRKRRRAPERRPAPHKAGHRTWPNGKNAPPVAARATLSCRMDFDETTTARGEPIPWDAGATLCDAQRR